MTVVTSCTSCQGNQVKSRKQGKIHIFQQENGKLKHPVITKGKEEAESEIWRPIYSHFELISANHVNYSY